MTSRTRRTSLERFALRFPGLTRRISGTAVRLGAVGKPTLAQFRAGFLAANEAFNRGDFAAAFAGLAPDCEWRTFAERPEPVLIGPEQVRRFWEEMLETFPEFRNEPVHFLQAADGVFVILNRWHGIGGASGVPAGVDHGGVWELRDGRPVHVREFSTWEQALSAAGLDPSIAADTRRAQRSGRN